MVSQAVINVVKLYLDELRRNNIQIDLAFLFGSQARGTAKQDSDIDVMLVSQLFDENKLKYVGKIWKATEISGYKIEPHAVGLKRFLEDDYSPLIGIVKKEGIEIN